MRRTPLLPMLMIAVLSAVLLAVGLTAARPDHPARPAAPTRPVLVDLPVHPLAGGRAPTAQAAAGPQRRAEGPWVRIMPMHRAVRLARQRFAGRVLDIRLIPASADHPSTPRIDGPDPAAASPAPSAVPIYRLRMVTPTRDVLDIRIDAISGRVVEVRGADLTAARTSPHRKDR